MTKTFSIFATCALVAGCAIPRQSPVWRQVVDAPRPLPSGENTSDAYAKNLHATLKKAGVQHKVVTYNYPFHSKFDGHGTAQRTSVIYRDSKNPDHPWWIMDERLSRPVWLPTDSVEKQVNFFLRRPAQVVTLREFGAGDAKSVAAPEKKTAVAQRVAPTTKLEAVADERPLLVTRVWRNAKSYFTKEEPAPVVQETRVAPSGLSRIVAPGKSQPVRVESTASAANPLPVVAGAPKRPLFRPAGVKPGPFFSSFKRGE